MSKYQLKVKIDQGDPEEVTMVRYHIDELLDNYGFEVLEETEEHIVESNYFNHRGLHVDDVELLFCNVQLLISLLGSHFNVQVESEYSL